MPAKDVVAKFWSPLVPSFDGLRYLSYPAGDKPSGFQLTPTLITTDIISGSTVNGEGGLGGYMTLFGHGLGRQAELGTAAGCRIYFRDPAGDNLWHEVANYRYLLKTRTYRRNQGIAVAVQLGSLGAAAAGHVLDIVAVVAGVSSNVLSAWFTVQPGHFFFVATTGDDATGVRDDIAHPFRYVQQANGGTTFTGVWDPGSTGLKAGDTEVIRGGEWGDQTGFDGKWLRPRTQTGSPPTGAAGHGYIHIVRYPGPILAHAPEYVHFTAPAGGWAIAGPTSGHSAAEGAGKYFSISGLHIECDPAAKGDAAPINWQSNADYWRVVDCELGPWMSTLVTGGTPTNAKAGGLAGSSIGGKILFAHIHDIGCDVNNPTTSALENHGIYFDGTAVSASDGDVEVGYCVIERVPGGSLIQWQSLEGTTFVNYTVHHNYLDTSAKYGLNIGPGAISIDVWNNVILNAGRNCVRFLKDSEADTDINIVHNTMRMGYSGSAYRSAFTQESSTMSAGSVVIAHNILVLAPGATAGTEPTSFIDFGTGVTAPNALVAENLYFDEDGVNTTVPPKDASGYYGDPAFTRIATGDYTCQPAGAGRAKCTQAEAIPVIDDGFGVLRPVPGTGAPGADRNDIGAYQGDGT